MARYVIVMYVTIDADDVEHAGEISDELANALEEYDQVVGVSEDDPKLEEGDTLERPGEAVCSRCGHTLNEHRRDDDEVMHCPGKDSTYFTSRKV